MKMRKTLTFTFAILIAAFFSAQAQAQSGLVVSFKGLEVSPGYEEPGEIYTWMCYARTSGSLPGNLTLTMDIEGAKAPNTTVSIVRGNWVLPVYVEATTKLPIRVTGYQGVVFGSIDAGSATWDKYGTSANLELKLTIRGGTQAMADFRGTAVLYGTVYYYEKGVPIFNGTIYFQ